MFCLPCWSAALQAVLIQVWTPARKPVLEQIQVASVTAQPVLPMALRAQVVYKKEREEINGQ